MKYLALDLETAESVPMSHWQKFLPIPVACVAIYDSATGECSVDWEKDVTLNHHLTSTSAVLIFERLIGALDVGYQVVTWNGANFDFRVLYSLCDGEISQDVVRQVVMRSTDPAFSMHATFGYHCGLQAACEGMGVEGKLEDENVSGAQAPLAWSKGEHDLVLKYVRQDARITGTLYANILKRGFMNWITKSKRVKSWMPNPNGRATRLPTVQESLELPEPDDTTWITNYRPVSSFVEWVPI